jgi:uncharacterized membrane protein
MDDAALLDIIHVVTRIVEVAGIVVILIGTVVAFGQFLLRLRGSSSGDRVAELRSGLGRSILLGLELLVAADIISTVAIEPTLDSLAVLAGIVLIRTFLSFSLEVEIEGRWPWQQARRDLPSERS